MLTSKKTLKKKLLIFLLIEVLRKKTNETEIIITGRNAVPELIEMADLVTEMREVKHYYNNGVQARTGIEC